MPTEDAYSSGHLVLSLSELAFILLFDTSDTPYRLDIIPVCDIITGLDIYTDSDISPNIGFHRASATGVACRQGTLTSPDTWSCGTCKCSFLCWDQSLLNLCCLRTFEFRTSLGTSVFASGRQPFHGFCGKVFPADSRYSNGNQLCPSSSRHISLLIWSRIYTVFALNRQEIFGISVRFHI